MQAYLSPTPRLAREIVKRRCATLPHRNFTPIAVLTELSPLFETVAGRENHYHSDYLGTDVLDKYVLSCQGVPILLL